MGNQSADVIIVGGGIIGCAAAYYLAKRGVSVLVCEKGDVGLEQSSRNWGFVRQQGRDEAELPLMMACNRMWRKLETELEADLEWNQGGNLALAYDRERMALFEKWQQVAKVHDLDTRMLASRELKQLVPASKARLLGAMYTPGDGHAEPHKLCPAYQKAARTMKVRFMTGCAVKQIEMQNRAVCGVLTEKGYFRSSTVVCAAGAWSTRLLRPLGIRLPTLWVKNSVAQLAPLRKLTDAGVWGRTAFRQKRDGRLLAALGDEGQHPLMIDSFRFLGVFLPAYLQNKTRLTFKLDRILIKDLLGRLNDFTRCRVLDPPAGRKAIRRALGYLGSDYERLGNIAVERTWAGYLDCTPDMLPVIDRLERPQNLVLATGFSGHGFGLGPIVGRLISEMIVDGKPSLNLNALRFSRFREGIGRKPVSVI